MRALVLPTSQCARTAGRSVGSGAPRARLSWASSFSDHAAQRGPAAGAASRQPSTSEPSPAAVAAAGTSLPGVSAEELGECGCCCWLYLALVLLPLPACAGNEQPESMMLPWGLPMPGRVNRTRQLRPSTPPPPACSHHHTCYPPADASITPKLVVFGGSGYVGSHVCEEGLRMGVAVTSINRSGRPKNLKGAWVDQVTWVQVGHTCSPGSSCGADASGGREGGRQGGALAGCILQLLFIPQAPCEPPHPPPHTPPATPAHACALCRETRWTRSSPGETCSKARWALCPPWGPSAATSSC